MVGSKKFGLGPEPKLETDPFVEKWETMGSEGMPIVESSGQMLHQYRYLSHLYLKCQTWKDEHAEWQQPGFYTGMFVKMKGDRWCCDEASRWRF